MMRKLPENNCYVDDEGTGEATTPNSSAKSKNRKVPAGAAASGTLGGQSTSSPKKRATAATRRAATGKNSESKGEVDSGPSVFLVEIVLRL